MTEIKSAGSDLPGKYALTVAKKIKINSAVTLLLIVILLLNILSIRNKSATYDEPEHLKYGEEILSLNADKFLEDIESTPHVVAGVMPISCLNAIPLKISGLFEGEKQNNHLGNLISQRFITVIFSLLLGLYIFKWTADLYGDGAGLFSLMLYAFSPNIIAHSRLVTMDLYATCMITVSMYYFWRFINLGGFKRALVSALTLGLSLLTKYSCALLYPILFIIAVTRNYRKLLNPVRKKDLGAIIRRISSFLKITVLFILIGVLIINVGFLFHKSFVPLAKLPFSCVFFKSIQSGLSLLDSIPVPIPYPYLQGLDSYIYSGSTMPTWGRLYMLGNLRQSPAFKGYYFIAFLYKVPITIQIFILLSVIHYIRKRGEYDFLNNELFLLVPVVFFSIYLNFIFSLNIGIRHTIIIFPFLHIFCGSLVSDWRSYSVKFRAVVVLLCVYLVISVLSYFPHYLSYFNELVWDRKQAYKILADSNIDWGQNEIYLNNYRSKNPHAHINPESPVSGTVVVGVNHLVGVTTSDPDKYKWLRDNYKPVGHIAYSYLIYDIPPGFR